MLGEFAADPHAAFGNAGRVSWAGRRLMQSPQIRDFISGLPGLKTAADFQSALDGYLRQIGFGQFSYVGINMDSAKERHLTDIEPEFIHLTNRLDWGMHYVKQDYAKADPIVRDCFQSRLPIQWTETYMLNTRSPEESLFMEDAWENGICRGYTVPIHGPGGELGLLMISSPENDKEFGKLMDAHRFELEVVAHHFHDAAQRTLGRQAAVPPPIPLTSRELEILKWTVDGKTAWEIGQIVHISERTVNVHLRNIMAKFGVHNKTHAAAKAINLGLFAGHASAAREQRSLL